MINVLMGSVTLIVATTLMVFDKTSLNALIICVFLAIIIYAIERK